VTPSEHAEAPRWLAGGEDLRGSIRLLDAGVAEIHRLGGANDFYELPLLVIATGLERLVKLTLAVALLERDGKTPPSREMRKKYGHRLAPLMHDLVAVVSAQPDYARRPAVRDDIAFLREDQRLSFILDLLGGFGQNGRFHRLDTLLGESTRAEEDPYWQWDELEMTIARDDPGWLELIAGPRYEDLRARVGATIAALIDRCVRALCRMWTLGALGDAGRRFSGFLSPFLCLHDDQLGVLRGD
jgi:hypothetical protein